MAETILDFFICHNKADEAWARWVDWQLRDAGFNTFVPDLDIQAGENEILAIDRALKDAKNKNHERKVIVILSSKLRTDSVQENYWATLFSQNQPHEKSSLIPIRIDKTDCPSSFLRGLRSIDLSDADEKSALKYLNSAIFSLNARSTDKPKFPGQNLAPLYPKDRLNNESISDQSNSLNKPIKKVNPIHLTAQLDRKEQAEKIIEYLASNNANNDVLNGKTLGYIAFGPALEWPTALQYKLCHVINNELINDDNKYLIPQLLQVEKKISDKTPKQRLLSLLKDFYGLKEKLITEDLIKSKLEQTSPSYMFVYELLSDEIYDYDFIVELLLAWRSIQLDSNSTSHFLILICEVDRIETQKKKWWQFGKTEAGWQEKMQMAIRAKKITEPLLLPALASPTWDHVNDWLKIHFVDDEQLRQQITNSLMQAFANSSAIPHRELMNKLLPYFQTH